MELAAVALASGRLIYLEEVVVNALDALKAEAAGRVWAMLATIGTEHWFLHGYLSN